MRYAQVQRSLLSNFWQLNVKRLTYIELFVNDLLFKSFTITLWKSWREFARIILQL